MNFDLDENDEVQSFSDPDSDLDDDDYEPHTKKTRQEKTAIRQEQVTALIKVTKLTPDHADIIASSFR